MPKTNQALKHGTINDVFHATGVFASNPFGYQQHIAQKRFDLFVGKANSFRNLSTASCECDGAIRGVVNEAFFGQAAQGRGDGRAVNPELLGNVAGSGVS